MLTGEGSVNVLTGGAGDDTLDGGVGADTLIGGTGNDTYFVDNVSDVVTENAGEGTDTVNVTAAITYTLGANVENGQVATTASGTTITGNALNNTLTGNTGNDTLIGGAGADALKAARGATRRLCGFGAGDGEPCRSFGQQYRRCGGR